MDSGKAPIEEAAERFLSNRRIAVTGVSRAPEGHGSNAVYTRLRDRGYEVFAVNPNAEEVEGDRAYPSLGAIDGGVDAVVIGTRPDRAIGTMRECVEMRVKNVWMHRAFGTGSYFRRCSRVWARAGHRGDRWGVPADVRTMQRPRAQRDEMVPDIDRQSAKAGVSLWAGFACARDMTV